MKRIVLICRRGRLGIVYEYFNLKSLTTILFVVKSFEKFFVLIAPIITIIVNHYQFDVKQLNAKWVLCSHCDYWIPINVAVHRGTQCDGEEDKSGV